MKNIVIIGAGGHAKVVVDIFLKRKKILKENINIVGFLDDSYSDDRQKYIFNIPILGKIDLIEKGLLKKKYEYIIGIGNNKVREIIFNKYKNIKYCTAVHPNAIIGEYVEIGQGTVIMANVVVNPDTKIGKHCILNTSSVVEHDNYIDDFVHISPNATLCGEVKIKKGSWIGANAVIKNQKKIGKDVIVGAGTVIIKDIEDNCTAVGNPGKVIKINKEV
nr:acetyltransferase [Fusobacterium gastrosuis]